jgi:hypothetical protein
VRLRNTPDTLRYLARAIVAGAFVVAVTTTARASDTVTASVTPNAPPAPVVTSAGGGGVTPGTIILDYVVIDTAFTTGLFATFDVNLAVVVGSGKAPLYPVPLSFADIGSPHVTMVASPDPMSIAGTGWTGTSTVSIYIPASVGADSALNADGAQLVGQLQLETPSGSKIDTPTTIKVRIKLVHPTACVRFFNFITDADLITTYTSIQVNVHPQNQRVQGTNPGRLSDNLLVVNTCSSPETFDLKVILDTLFTTAPSGNPGNAVFTYSTSGAIEPNTFVFSSFGTGTPRGQALCLQNLTIAPGTTLLTAVKMDLNPPVGMVASQLPTAFGFSGELYGAGSTCSLPLASAASPNPVQLSLGYTLK